MARRPSARLDVALTAAAEVRRQRRARRLLALGLTGLLAAAGCGTPMVSDAPLPSGNGPRSAAPSASGGMPVEPGRPYDGPEILAAMRASTRLGGVPDELETPAVAAAIARELWTFTGAKWEALSVTGRCAGAECVVELVASAPDAQAADSYTFVANRDSGEVELTAAALTSVPAATVAQLDAAIRRALPAGRLEGMVAIGAAWAPPPEDTVTLAYRSGGEEGSPALDVRVDRRTGTILELLQPG